MKRSDAQKIASTFRPTLNQMKKNSLTAFRSRLKRKACSLYKEIEAQFPLEGDSESVLAKKTSLGLCERLLLNPRKFSIFCNLINISYALL